MITNKIVVTHERYGELRVVIVGNEAWYVAADVCNACGIRNFYNILKDLPDNCKRKCSMSYSTYVRKIICINAQGMRFIQAVMRRRKDDTDHFSTGYKSQSAECLRRLQELDQWFKAQLPYATAEKTATNILQSPGVDVELLAEAVVAARSIINEQAKLLAEATAKLQAAYATFPVEHKKPNRWLFGGMGRGKKDGVESSEDDAGRGGTVC